MAVITDTRKADNWEDAIVTSWDESALADHTRTNSADMTTAADVSPAADSGHKLVLKDLVVSTDTAMNFQLQEETSATVVAGPYYLPANGTIQITPLARYLKLPTADRKIQGKASVAGNITVECWTISEA